MPGQKLRLVQKSAPGLLCCVMLHIYDVKVKKLVQKDVTRDVSVGYQRCFGKPVNLKLLNVPYNSWFFLYIQTRACEKRTNVKCFNLVQCP